MRGCREPALGNRHVLENVCDHHAWQSWLRHRLIKLILQETVAVASVTSNSDAFPQRSLKNSPRKRILRCCVEKPKMQPLERKAQSVAMSPMQWSY